MMCTGQGSTILDQMLDEQEERQGGRPGRAMDVVKALVVEKRAEAEVLPDEQTKDGGAGPSQMDIADQCFACEIGLEGRVTFLVYARTGKTPWVLKRVCESCLTVVVQCRQVTMLIGGEHWTLRPKVALAYR